MSTICSEVEESARESLDLDQRLRETAAGMLPVLCDVFHGFRGSIRAYCSVN